MTEAVSIYQRPLPHCCSNAMWSNPFLRRQDRWTTLSRRFFSTFKREKAYWRDYTSEKHFRRSTAEYISSTMRFASTKPCNIRRPRYLKIYITLFYEKTVSKYRTGAKVLVLRLAYFWKTLSEHKVMSRFGPVDKIKNSAETRSGPGRTVNLEIEKDGIYHSFKV